MTRSTPVPVDNPRPIPSGIIWCVVDVRQATFELDLVRWYASLTKLASVNPTDLRVYIVGTAHSRVVDVLRSRGVSVLEIAGFDERHRPCNKVGAALALADAAYGDLCVVSDPDEVFFEDPRSIAVPSGHVGMRPVDVERPKLDVLLKIFDAAEVDLPAIVPVGTGNGRTVSGNGNGGFYLVPTVVYPEVARGWAKWSTWLLNRELLPRLDHRRLCTDQVAMALTLAEKGLGMYAIDSRWNVPTHLPLFEPSAPAMIHYHRKTSRDGRILPTGVAVVDELVKVANAAAADAWRADFARGMTDRALMFSPVGGGLLRINAARRRLSQILERQASERVVRQ